MTVQTIKITMELTLDQARSLFGPAEKLALEPNRKKPKDLVALHEKVMSEVIAPGKGRGQAPYLADATLYRSEGGVGQGRRGRPNALTVDGMRVVWKFYNEGFSVKEIHQAFNGVISVDGIRRLIHRIAKAKGKV